MEKSQIFRPTAQVYNSVLVGLIRRCKDSKDPESHKKCLEIINAKMIPTSCFDKKSVVLAVEAYTAISNTREDPILVLKNCISIMHSMRTGFSSPFILFYFIL